MPDAQPSSTGFPGRPGASPSGALVRLALLAQVVLLEPACLPQEKLSSYSRASTDAPAEGAPDAATTESTERDASAGSGGALAGNGGTSGGGNGGINDSGGAPVDARDTSGGELDASATPTSIDAAPTDSDAGAVPLTTPLTDAGSTPLAP